MRSKSHSEESEDTGIDLAPMLDFVLNLLNAFNFLPCREIVHRQLFSRYVLMLIGIGPKILHPVDRKIRAHPYYRQFVHLASEIMEVYGLARTLHSLRYNHLTLCGRDKLHYI